MPQNYNSNPENSAYSWGNPGFSTGNTVVDAAFAIAMGQGMPRPLSGSSQSMFDSYTARRRMDQIIQANTQAFAGNQFFRNFRDSGLATDSLLTKFGAPILGQPYGLLDRMMMPFNNGSSIAGQMGLVAQMNAMSMGSFGSFRNMSAGQTANLNNQLFSSIMNPNGSVNYGRTAGMSNEDLMGAWGSGVSNRMFGIGTGNFDTSMTKFIEKGGGGLLRSAAGVFGPGTGREQMERISQLMGTSSFGENDMGKVEDTLRSVKAASKVAGVSIEVIKEIISTAQGLAAQSQNLRGLGGFSATQMGLGAFTSAHAMRMSLSESEHRRQGGDSGIAMQALQSQIQTADSPFMTGISALYAYSKDRGQGVGDIQNFIKSGDRSGVGLRKFMASKGYQFNMAMSDPINAARGRQMLEREGLSGSLIDAGNDMLLGELKFGAGVNDKDWSKLMTDLESSDDAMGSINRSLPQATANRVNRILNMNPGRFETALQQQSGTFKKSRDTVMSLQKAYASADKEFDVLSSGRYRDLTTQLLQGGLNKKYSKEGFFKFFGEVFGGSLNERELAASSNDFYEMSSRFGEADLSKNFAGFKGATGIDLNNEDQLRKLGISSYTIGRGDQSVILDEAKGRYKLNQLNQFETNRINNQKDRLANDPITNQAIQEILGANYGNEAGSKFQDKVKGLLKGGGSNSDVLNYIQNNRPDGMNIGVNAEAVMGKWSEFEDRQKQVDTRQAEFLDKAKLNKALEAILEIGGIKEGLSGLTAAVEQLKNG